MVIGPGDRDSGCRESIWLQRPRHRVDHGLIAGRDHVDQAVRSAPAMPQRLVFQALVDQSLPTSPSPVTTNRRGRGRPLYRVLGRWAVSWPRSIRVGALGREAGGEGAMGLGRLTQRDAATPLMPLRASSMPLCASLPAPRRQGARLLHVHCTPRVSACYVVSRLIRKLRRTGR
jgi:hypothetical protein